MKAPQTDRRQAIREVLFTVWDPIGTRGFGPKDEYDPYIDDVDTLLRSGKGDRCVVLYLAWVETERMGLPRREESRLEPVVRALRQVG